MARLLHLVLAVAVLAALWVVPPLLLPHPQPNQYIELSNLVGLVFLLALVASLGSLVAGWVLRWSGEGAIGAGTLWVAMGPVAALALLTIGNLTDDAFLPLFFMGFLTVPVGVGMIAGGVLSRGGRGRIQAAVWRGVLGATVVAAWILARGGVEWKVAPFGLDAIVVLALAVAGVTYLGVWRRAPAPGAEAEPPLAPAPS